MNAPNARAALILSDYGAPYPGSFIPSMRALSAILKQRGWSVEFGFTSPAEGQPWLEDLRSEGWQVSIAPPVSGDQLAHWVLSRLEAAPGPAVLHTHFTAFERVALTAARERPQTALIWQVHTYLTRRPPGRFARQLFKYGWLGRRVDRIVCVGAATAHEVRLRGARRDRVRVVPNGIDVSRFELVDSQERARARAELGLDPTAPVLVHFGWEWVGKGGPLFAAMLARLRDRGVEAIGLAVGGGEPARAAAGRLGLDGQLIPIEPSADVRRFYAAADALVATSIGEGGDPTFSILEALCCGVAVVATDIPGHRVAPDGPAAVRLATEDPGALAEQVAALLARDPGQREAEGREAHAWVAARRGLERPAAELADIYDELVSAS